MGIFKLMDQNLLQQLLGAQLGGLQNQEAQEEPKTNNLQFRAGMMKRTGTTVTADARKGYVRVFKDENQLTHFTWKERTKQGTEMDLMLFPDDAEVFMIPTPPATGRCFALRLKAANRINFFWLQEPSDAKDAEYITKMNGLLNPGGAAEADKADNSSTAAQSSEPAAAPPVGDTEEDEALRAALAMSMQVDDEPAVTPAAVPPAGDTEEDDALQAALAMSMAVDEPAVTPEAAAPAAPPAAPAPAGVMDDEDEDDAALQAAIAMSMAASEPEKPPSDDDSDLYD